ncbi:amidase family protein [Caballeronia mineralivorans]|uniref:amidase family protein n=1 Tax=Caballeronia mineralivorans TaxID=2010198 RepID=UPI0023EFA2B6|nr:amidase family protein [Caballeronia mineralivorans]
MAQQEEASGEDVYGDAALLAARDSDARRSRNQARGPLDGVPFAAKDLFDVEGFATLAGSKASTATAAVRSRLAVAGSDGEMTGPVRVSSTRRLNITGLSFRARLMNAKVA